MIIIISPLWGKTTNTVVCMVGCVVLGLYSYY